MSRSLQESQQYLSKSFHNQLLKYICDGAAMNTSSCLKQLEVLIFAIKLINERNVYL